MKPKLEIQMRTWLKRSSFAAAVLAVLTIGVVTVFGDNIRKLFGMSADGLAGNDVVGMRAAPSNRALETKAMKSFAMSNSYGDGPAVQGNTYAPLPPSPTVDTRADRFSTFAIDVDTASYSRARQEILEGAWPAQGGVRVEEWVNAFRYRLEAPTQRPFAISVEGAPSPFTEGHTLVKVSLQGRQVANAERDPAHLVYLVDTSCSMSGDRIALAKESMKILTRNLNPRDTVSIVTYAGSVEDVLPPTPAGNQTALLDAIDDLNTGGGTSMGSGMKLAYAHARERVQPGHVSRVLVFTDGDANIGATSPRAILDAVRDEVKAGVTLTAVGFGMGNYRDDLMEKLADAGNGQCVYIDSIAEAKKVFEQNISGTLQVIAKDVKVQVEFDPDAVQSYRLLGYEDREVADKDFRNDEVDGGEIGAGHSVSALYDVVLAGKPSKLGTVRVRGKLPEASEAFEVERAIGETDFARTLDGASTELRFAVSVAIAADVVRGNAREPQALLARALSLARGSTRELPERRQFLALLDRLVEHERLAVR